MIPKNEMNQEYEVGPTNIDPPITQSFVADMRRKAEKGTYRVGVNIGNSEIQIDVFPGVFPPQSDYSVSSRSVFESLGDLSGREVADIGCGTGIESIVAIMAGANHVDATDINPTAVRCTKLNVENNSLVGKVEVRQGDLCQGLPKKKYDVIIANLPIVNHLPSEMDDAANALYDPGMALHKRLFSDAKDFLEEEGVITFTHANLQSAHTDNPLMDFEILDHIIKESGYEVVKKAESTDLGYTWINYKIKLKK